MERTVHWVSSFGLVFSVLYTTSATCSSEIDRGAPGRSSSYKPVEAVFHEATTPLADGHL